jgi:hypothetical protein
MSKPAIYADFNNADPRGRLRLNTIGTIEDLSRMGIELCEGLRLTLHDEELEADGEAQFSPEEKLWVALIDWNRIRRKPAGQIDAP